MYNVEKFRKVGYLNERLKAFGYAFQGLADFFRSGAHPKIHLLAILLISLLGFYFSISAGEWTAVLICCALVLSMEAINSALEYLTDLASPDIHPLAKKTKDIAAAAVLISAVFSLIIALIIFIPKF